MLLPFELDPQIIHHIIYSQAGSIGKALIELLMNSADAGATKVNLTITKEGFTCTDDGNGFASREDVIRYFGRFGTPHIEGDATYGRFRLGRGQVMAHAATKWSSRHWVMTVDTRSTGYSYDLEDQAECAPGCVITGTWYDPMTTTELVSTTQEVRDLVRYTPVSIALNGQIITRNPTSEKWDFEDEFAYYRGKDDGAVAIYNQGVLVRHDPGHIWGAGGLIVTKQAIGLNVSRTEILRKTCPVWKEIAKRFRMIADEICARTGDHRKTESSREKSARELLSGDAPNLWEIYGGQEVISVLPGKRHITLDDFLRRAQQQHKGAITIVERDTDVPKGESIARERIVQVVHPQTLARFGCYTPEEFRECLTRIIVNLKATKQGSQAWAQKFLQPPALLCFTTLKEAFVEHMRIVSEVDTLDKETRRAWTALRWCLDQYAQACAGSHYKNRSGRVSNNKQLNILLGQSNTAEAWTDGKTYLAINESIVQKLKRDPLRTASYIFSLVEHEVAHQGDSLACGHDEAFYQRFHDISVRMSSERQWYMHKWIIKYTYSLEGEGKRSNKRASGELYLLERAGSGRQKRDLPALIGNMDEAAIAASPVRVEDRQSIALINGNLVNSGLTSPPPNWPAVFEQAKQAQDEKSAQWHAELEQGLRQRMRVVLSNKEFEQARSTFAQILQVEPKDLPRQAVEYMLRFKLTDQELRDMWADNYYCWNDPPRDEAYEEEQRRFYEEREEDFLRQDAEESESLDKRLGAKFLPLVRPGETWWGLQRNAAAAGFHRVPDYLAWRDKADKEASPLPPSTSV
jgi:hypothetical protein